MASVTKENLGNLHDQITVKISKEDYLPSFEKAIKTYSKKANIPGFRKGMVPPGMVKKMYGSAIYVEEVVKTVNKELTEYLNKEALDIFGQPLPLENAPSDLDMKNPADYDFSFEIGLKPEVNLDGLSSTKTILYKVKVSPEMIDEEIEKLVTKNGELKDAEEVTVDENVLNVFFEESDAEGNPVENGISKDNSILLKYFSEKYKQELMGKKVGDSVVFQLQDAFPEKEKEWILSDLDLQKDDPASQEKFFKMSITKIGLVEKKELNEEFFNQVFPGKDIKTEEDFRKVLGEEIQKQWDIASHNQLQDQIYHALIDTPIEFPETFLKHWMEKNEESKKTKEEVEAEYPHFIQQLKWTLISDKIIKDQQLTVTADDMRKGMKEEVMGYFGQMNPGEEPEWIESYIDRMMKEEKQVDSSYRKLMTTKLFNWLESQVTPEEKETTSEEFLHMQEQHHHH